MKIIMNENQDGPMGKIARFHNAHGAECYSDGSLWYYADGAYRDVSPLGILAEPPRTDSPEGEFQKAQNVLLFYEAKLKVAVDEFDRMDDALRFSTPADEEAAIAELERLAAIVEERKMAAHQAREALGATQWGRRRNAMREEQAVAKQKFDNFQQRRRAVRI